MTKKFESPWRKEAPMKYRLPSERKGRTVRFEIYSKVGDETDEIKKIVGYFNVGLYEDGYPGELFIYAGKQGEETHGWVNSVAKAVSMLLQYGVSPEEIYYKLMWDEYEPKGITNIKEAPICKSIINMIFRYMRANFPPTKEEARTSYDDALGSLVEVTEMGEKEDGDS